MRIYWLDYEGHRKPYGTISPGGRQDQQTFETHPFVLTDENDRALAIFVAGTETALATLEQ